MYVSCCVFSCMWFIFTWEYLVTITNGELISQALCYRKVILGTGWPSNVSYFSVTNEIFQRTFSHFCELNPFDVCIYAFDGRWERETTDDVKDGKFVILFLNLKMNCESSSVNIHVSLLLDNWYILNAPYRTNLNVFICCVDRWIHQNHRATFAYAKMEVWV